MAEISKNDVEVDLDTDDVKPETIDVEPAKMETESKDVNLQKEQIEQEGSEIIRDKTPIDVVEDTPVTPIISAGDIEPTFAVAD